MCDFDDAFEITEEDLTQLQNIEISLLNSSFHISSDEEERQIVPTRQNRRRIIRSDSEGSNSGYEVSTQETSIVTPTTSSWCEPTGKQRHIIPFTDISGAPLHVRLSMTDKSPIDFYSLFVTDDVFQQIVHNTNQYAIHNITSMPEALRGARINQCSPANIKEIKKIFGLILFMGLVKLPRLANYWSKDKILGHPFPRTVMSRNRFELLLKMLHFSDKDYENKEDRLHQVRQLVNSLNENYKKKTVPLVKIFVLMKAWFHSVAE